MTLFCFNCEEVRLWFGCKYLKIQKVQKNYNKMTFDIFMEDGGKKERVCMTVLEYHCLILKKIGKKLENKFIFLCSL